jgi:RNA polymerase sigma-70 factor (subfamily 1)
VFDCRLEDNLIADAATGDRVALGMLLVAHYNELARRLGTLIPASVGHLISVDDIVQQTYVAALANIDEFRFTSASAFAAWLQKIAENQFRDTVDLLAAKKRGAAWRKARRADDPRASSLISLARSVSQRSDTPGRKLARREAIEAVRAGLQSLPSTQRQAVRLHHFDGRTLEETATEMERTPGAVRGLLQRARRGLRDALGRSSRWFSKR